MIALALAVLAANSPMPRAAEPLLVTTAWLAEHLKDRGLVIFQIGDQTSRPAYDGGHIPGAQFLNPFSEISAPMVKGALSLELPSAERLDSVLEAKGISNDSRVVLYWAQEYYSPTSRTLFTLECAGLAGRVSILDGGLEVWKQEGRPVSTEIPAVARGNFVVRPNTSMVADADYVKAHLDDRTVRIVDARDTVFYQGTSRSAQSNGHLPGAANIPFATMVDSSRMLSPMALKGRFAAAGITEGSLLVSPEWLATHRTDPGVVILHVSMEKAEYDREHVSGARWVDPHALIRNGPPGTELPAIETIDSVLEALGITDQSRIVFYGDTWMAPRVFLALEYAGLGNRTALLDGGLPAYRAANGLVSNQLPTWSRGSVTTRAHPEIVVVASWLAEHRKDPGLTLTDGRSAGEYAATDLSERLPRPGHIPGAVNLPWEQTFTDGAAALEGVPSRLKSKTELRKLFENAGFRDGKQLVTYCTIGLRASHLYFVARYLGLQPRLYDGSMSEWSRNTELPVVTGASPH